jgi:hypothetical protein
VHDGEIGSVNIALDAAGTINVVYSVPVNENRGIYLIQSEDGGTSWSKPLQVFDGALAGFDIVGTPSVFISPNGLFHILWKEQLIEGDGVPQSLSLYYTRSEDGGRTFGDAELIIEEPVSWREMMTDGAGNLHLLWQPQGTPTTVWDQISVDGGRSWQVPQGLPDEGATAAMVVDPVGRVHLLDAGSSSLGHWLWDGNRWQSEEPLQLSSTLPPEVSVESMAATVNKQGKMIVVLTAPSATGDAAEMMLLYSTRTLELPQEQTAVQEVVTPTLLPPTPAPATATSEGLPTQTTAVGTELADSQAPTDRSQNNPISPFAIALIPVALLLLTALGIVIRRAARPAD